MFFVARGSSVALARIGRIQPPRAELSRRGLIARVEASLSPEQPNKRRCSDNRARSVALIFPSCDFSGGKVRAAMTHINEAF